MEQGTSLYDRLMRLKPADISANKWTAMAGVNRNVFADIRKNDNAAHTTIEKLLTAIGLSWPDLYGTSDKVLSEVQAAPGLQDSRRSYGAAPSAKPPLPLLGSARGGDLDDITERVEMVELHLTEVLDYIRRPPELDHDIDAYALSIVGSSMVPRFRPGETVTVSTRPAPMIGDDVIVQLKAFDGHEERVRMVLIKELVRRTASWIELRQYNPLCEFRVPADRIHAIHKVRGLVIQ